MNILYFSSVNWRWIKQRPHFESYYMAENGDEVTYFSITPLFKQKKGKRIKKGKLSIRDIYVFPLASKSKLIEWVNRQIAKMILREKYDKVILTHPKQYAYLPNKLQNESDIIYECMDNMPYFYSGKLRELTIIQEKILCEKASKIIVSSNYLSKELVERHNVNAKKIYVLKNAVDKSFISNIPSKLTLKSPNLIYIGTVSEWVDVDIIIKFARENKSFYIYIVGPIEKKIKEVFNEVSNIIVVGAVLHDEVKEYIVSGDIMLIPFKVNKLIEGVDPVKMYEYIAYDKPIISSYWKELNEFKAYGNVKFYSNYKEFKESVVNSLKQIKNEVRVNKEFVEENSWDERVRQFIKYIR